MNRREFIAATGAAAVGLTAGTLPAGWAAPPGAPRKHILFFTKSSGFEHPAIKRTGGKLSFAEQLLTDLGKQHDFDVTCSKDGGLFTPDGLKPFDAFLFYTTGDLTVLGTDGNPPMPPEGKELFLNLIKNGVKGFAGTHSATDTFHTHPDDRYVSYGDHVDPYVEMIGAEFIHHDKQQKATMKVVDRAFPGFADAGSEFALMEEWYSLKDFRPNLHVLLIQETAGMEGSDYQRPPYPATWARMHGKGRVFYTSMGHREDVWTNPLFQSILLGGLSWVAGSVTARVPANVEKVTPGAWTLPPRPQPKKP